MKEIKLELFSSDKNEIQDNIKEAFNFPDYYGRNLDAFHDCLSEICEDTFIEIIMDENDPYHQKVIKVLKDSANENENIKVEIVQE